jgi:3-phosphoshikimate 1-carboxyvinyltransferase
MSSMPDVAPTLMMLAPFLDRPTHITGLATLRVKECDRIAAPTRELRKLGVSVEEGPDFMVIAPLGGAGEKRLADSLPARVEIETYHDHRIAMSFGVLGSRLPGLRILDPGCVAKTYPNYWSDWQRARAAPRQQS